MREMRSLTRVLALVVVAVVFCAPLFRGLTSVDQENDEAIYSYAAQSLLETGDWMNPRSSPDRDTVFLEKPPLKFWIVALPIRLGLLPNDDFGLRFWDPVFGSLAFLYVFAFGRRLAGWSCGAVAVLTLCTFSDLLFTHGLRGNNMEAPLVLAYAAGIYHYLRWAESERPAMARAHAAAVGACFFLAFMTKFVAAAFMPAVMVAASIELRDTRSKLLREWRTWLAVGAGVLLLSAPWFVYQSLQPGRGVWSIMLGEHVVKRFQSSLEASHVHPWYYYVQSLVGVLVNRGTVWAVVTGAILLHWRVFRERWLAGTLVLYWFWLPFVAISAGSSKLWHYAYPFLPPVSLAAGYTVAAIANAAARGIAALQNTTPPRRFTIPSQAAALQARLRPAWRWVRNILTVTAAVALVLGAIGLLQPGRVHAFGLTFRHQEPIRSALFALLLGLLAGRGPMMARLAVPLLLLTIMPVNAYQEVLRKTVDEAHPQRSTSECLANVRREEQAAGRRVHDMAVYLPPGTYSHSLFFYFRKFGWDRRQELDAPELLRMMDDQAEQRPVLLPRDYWLAIHAKHDPPGTVRSWVVVTGYATVLLPGPYARCWQ
jgi:hypothetical protein